MMTFIVSIRRKWLESNNMSTETTLDEIDEDEIVRRKSKRRRGKTKNHYKYRSKYKGPRPNFSRFMPDFGGLCDFCGGDNHFRDRCKVPLSSDERCEYPICTSPETHLTKMCFTMHRLCSMCLYRGHAPKQCHEFTMDEKREAFKNHYRNGLFTSLADEISLQWGFHFPKRLSLLPTTDQLLKPKGNKSQTVVEEEDITNQDSSSTDDEDEIVPKTKTIFKNPFFNLLNN